MIAIVFTALRLRFAQIGAIIRLGKPCPNIVGRENAGKDIYSSAFSSSVPIKLVTGVEWSYLKA